MLNVYFIFVVLSVIGTAISSLATGYWLSGGCLSVAEDRRQQLQPIMKGYMYILKCADGSYYTGSTIHLEYRFNQHQNGEGANHTKKHLPVELVYYEEFNRIDHAFYREKQVQGWSRKKKEALINNKPEDLHLLSVCNNNTHYSNFNKDTKSESAE